MAKTPEQRLAEGDDIALKGQADLSVSPVIGKVLLFTRATLDLESRRLEGTIVEMGKLIYKNSGWTWVSPGGLITKTIPHHLELGRSDMGSNLVVSRVHFSLTPNGNNILVADLGSTNGTWVRKID